MSDNLSDQDLQIALSNIEHLSLHEKERVLDLLEERERAKRITAAREDFLCFVKEIWPTFIPGPHHRIMADAFNRVAREECKRLIVNMAPRHTKSEFTSWLLPAWLLGLNARRKIIQASNTEALASGFGRRVRNLIDGEMEEPDEEDGELVDQISYADIFPGVKLAKDSQAAAGWHTNKGGEYFAIGVNGRVTGKGANCAYFTGLCETRKGHTQIVDIKVGDEVLGYDHGTGKTKWAKVRAVSTQLKLEIVNVNGFICTPEHEIYTPEGYERAGSLEENGARVLVIKDDDPVFTYARSSYFDTPAARYSDDNVIFSSDAGVSARDLEGLLQGEGHWVVDIQTDTENFFCNNVLAHNCFIVDDPHSEQEAKQAETNPDIFDTVYDWYTSGPRQRLQPGGSIIVVMTRWAKRDLTGRVLKKQLEDTGSIGDKWEVIELPALLDENTKSERPMWPEFWTLPELRATREALPVSKWKAQYQQQPTSEEGAIIKRDSWRTWGSDDEECPHYELKAMWDAQAPPPCLFTISSWDTALTKTQRADYSAMTTWGVFEVEDPDTGKVINNIILLSAYKDRMEFPELKTKVKQFYNEDLPDCLLIENKGSGISLIQELRSAGTPAESFNFGRGGKGVSNDKVARANLISDIFSSGYVWAPDRRFADEVMTECAEFPNGDHDDYVDSVVQAMLRFRAGGLISTQHDEDDDDIRTRFNRKRMY